MSKPEPWIGQHIGRYRILRRLGSGAFGTVYLAEQSATGKLVALKVLSTHLSGSEELRRFLNEARIVRLHHPHIVPVLDFGLSEQDKPFLVMEYAAGGTVDRRYPRGSALPLEKVVRYVKQVAAALQYAHEHQVIHRDVKPENLLLRDDGSMMLSDFGISKLLEQSSSQSLQTRVGTPAYMAPEQGQGKPCPASDQYALAVVTYEWLTGHRPFQGTSIEVAVQHRLDPPPSLCSLNPEVTPEVEQVVLRALAKAPEDRFASVSQFAQALEIAAGQPSRLDERCTRILLSDQHPKGAETYVLPSSSGPFASELYRESGETATQSDFPSANTIIWEQRDHKSGASLETVQTPHTPILHSRQKLQGTFWRGKFFLLLTIAVLLFGLGGGIWFFFVHPQAAPPQPQKRPTQLTDDATPTQRGIPFHYNFVHYLKGTTKFHLTAGQWHIILNSKCGSPGNMKLSLHGQRYSLGPFSLNQCNSVDYIVQIPAEDDYSLEFLKASDDARVLGNGYFYKD